VPSLTIAFQSPGADHDEECDDDDDDDDDDDEDVVVVEGEAGWLTALISSNRKVLPIFTG
jgi:hypothetical protein